MNEIIVISEGYSKMIGTEQMRANCSCTVIKGTHNIIIDTMTAWDSDKILSALKKSNLTPNKIDYVISTHGHSDHMGNNNLFLDAKHIVGFSVYFKDIYSIHPFDKGDEYVINDSVKVIPTPGHTLSDVTVIVTNTQSGTYAITGDLFEKLEDIEDSKIWLEAGSENSLVQRKNRLKVAKMADWIIPGHGPKFQVTETIRACLRKQYENS